MFVCIFFGSALGRQAVELRCTTHGCAHTRENDVLAQSVVVRRAQKYANEIVDRPREKPSSSTAFPISSYVEFLSKKTIQEGESFATKVRYGYGTAMATVPEIYFIHKVQVLVPLLE